MPKNTKAVTKPDVQSGENISDSNTDNNSSLNIEEVTILLKSIQKSVAKTEAKVDKLVDHINLLETKVAESEERVGVVEGKLVESEEKVSRVVAELEKVNKNYAAILKRVQELEAIANTTQQRFRMQSIRVYNMARDIKNSREAAIYLYDSLFKKVFTDANTGNHPGAFRTIEYCHILPCLPGNEEKYKGHNYIIRFASRFWKQLFFDHKKDVVSSYNRDNDEKIKVAHDYTHQNRICLANLHNDELVKRVTFRGDRVMFKLEEAGAWKVVTNPFGATAKDMVEEEVPSA